MRRKSHVLTILILNILLISLIHLLFSPVSIAQYPGIDESFDRYRKGEIIVNASPGANIKIEQLNHEFWFGCAISNSLAGGGMSENDLKQYKEKFLQNFNSAVTENAVKWYSMEPRKDEVHYSIVDGILQWTEENNIPLRGHNLFWGISRFVQPWIKELDDDELRQRIKDRAETLTAKYKGRFAEYDLNNEMIHGNYYEERLGPEITKLMAQWALEGDPGAKLFVNDYEILTGKRLADYMAHIRNLLKQGIPITGIGVQGHSHGDTFDREQMKIALDSLAKLKLPVRITEFNMPGQHSKYYNNRNIVLTQEEEEFKANELTDFYRICFAHPAVEGILMWGFWEGANWIPVSSLYKRDWSPTPAAEAYHNLVYDEWWTKESGNASSDGTYSTRGFFGKYRITVNGISKEIELSKQKGTATVDFRK
jgi:endo-1,4-beta-xylanase